MADGDRPLAAFDGERAELQAGRAVVRRLVHDGKEQRDRPFRFAGGEERERLFHPGPDAARGRRRLSRAGGGQEEEQEREGRKGGVPGARTAHGGGRGIGGAPRRSSQVVRTRSAGWVSMAPSGQRTSTATAAGIPPAAAEPSPKWTARSLSEA